MSSPYLGFYFNEGNNDFTIFKQEMLHVRDILQIV